MYLNLVQQHSENQICLYLYTTMYTVPHLTAAHYTDHGYQTGSPPSYYVVCVCALACTHTHNLSLSLSLSLSIYIYIYINDIIIQIVRYITYFGFYTWPTNQLFAMQRLDARELDDLLSFPLMLLYTVPKTYLYILCFTLPGL
jgi:hypothetical protein